MKCLRTCARKFDYSGCKFDGGECRFALSHCKFDGGECRFALSDCKFAGGLVLEVGDLFQNAPLDFVGNLRL